MPRYDVFLEGRTENSTCYFGVAVMADDQKEAEFLEQLDAGECKGIKSATAYKIAEFAREQGYLE